MPLLYTLLCVLSQCFGLWKKVAILDQINEKKTFNLLNEWENYFWCKVICELLKRFYVKVYLKQPW